MGSQGSTAKLKRVLGRWDLLWLGIGQIVGGGIFVLLGVGIGMTGRSVNLALMISSLFSLVISIPVVLIGGTIRMRGGLFTQCALFVGNRFAGFFLIVHLVMLSMCAMLTIGFVYYLESLVPGVLVYKKAFAIGFFTLLVATNVLGVKTAARFQKILILSLALAMALFIAFGIGQIQPGYFQEPGFMSKGLLGLLTAASILTVSTMGATDIINFGAEARNPTRDVPFVIIAATFVVAAFYALLSTVGAGVLPLAEVAGKPLGIVAKVILPTPLFYFFVVGGAMIGVLASLNAIISWGPKPLMQACDNGWFPAKWAAVNDRFKTPHWLLLGIYVIGIIPILADWNIEFIVNYALVAMRIITLFLSLAVVRLPTLLPDVWARSKYHVSTPTLWVVALLAGAATLVQLALLVANMDGNARLGACALVAGAVVFAALRGRKVTMDTCYEAA